MTAPGTIVVAQLLEREVLAHAEDALDKPEPPRELLLVLSNADHLLHLVEHVMAMLKRRSGRWAHEIVIHYTLRDVAIAEPLAVHPQHFPRLTIGHSRTSQIQELPLSYRPFSSFSI